MENQNNFFYNTPNIKTAIEVHSNKEEVVTTVNSDADNPADVILSLTYAISSFAQSLNISIYDVFEIIFEITKNYEIDVNKTELSMSTYESISKYKKNVTNELINKISEIDTAEWLQNLSKREHF